ncbi:MAG: OmpA family protein [Rhizobiaceae bacterium]
MTKLRRTALLLATALTLPVLVPFGMEADAQTVFTQRQIILQLQQPQQFQQPRQQKQKVLKRRAPEAAGQQVPVMRPPEPNNGRVAKFRAPEPNNGRVAKFRAPQPDNGRVQRIRPPEPEFGNNNGNVARMRAPEAEKPRVAKMRAPEVETPRRKKPRNDSIELASGNTDSNAPIQRGIDIRTSGGQQQFASNYPDNGRIDLEILFDYDSDRIDPTSVRQLIILGEALNDPSLGSSRFVVAGHTDAAGSDGYNADLSYRRAIAVAGFLVDYAGVSPDRLVTEGYGERLLKYPDAPESGQNRRVEIINLGDAG